MSPMETIPIEIAGASAGEVSGESAEASDDFSVDMEKPMTGPMDSDFEVMPWEATEPFDVAPGDLVAPWPNSTMVTTPPGAVERAAQRYLEGVAALLPPKVREGFLRGAGMFDLPASRDEGLDDLFE